MYREIFILERCIIIERDRWDRLLINFILNVKDVFHVHICGLQVFEAFEEGNANGPADYQDFSRTPIDGCFFYISLPENGRVIENHQFFVKRYLVFNVMGIFY